MVLHLQQSQPCSNTWPQESWAIFDCQGISGGSLRSYLESMNPPEKTSKSCMLTGFSWSPIFGNTHIYYILSGWWFQILFIFTPILGEMIRFDVHIFQLGWFKHQLETLWPNCLTGCRVYNSCQYTLLLYYVFEDILRTFFTLSISDKREKSFLKSPYHVVHISKITCSFFPTIPFVTHKRRSCLRWFVFFWIPLDHRVDWAPLDSDPAADTSTTERLNWIHGAASPRMGGNPTEDYKHYKDQTDPAKGRRRYIFHKVVESAQGCEIVQRCTTGILWMTDLLFRCQVTFWCGWTRQFLCSLVLDEWDMQGKEQNTREQILNIYRVSRDHWGNWKVSREKRIFSSVLHSGSLT